MVTPAGSAHIMAGSRPTRGHIPVHIDQPPVKSDQLQIPFSRNHAARNIGTFLAIELFMIRKKTYAYYIFPAVFMLTMVFHVQSGSAQSLPEQIVGYINALRSAPFAHAERLGLSPATIAAQCPWLKAGYPPYELNSFLNTKAALQGNGDTLLQSPAPAPENDFAGTADTGGEVYFYNFMSPEAALGIILDNLFLSELTPTTSSPVHILTEAYHHAGGSISGATDPLTGQNRYTLSICLGSAALKTEMQLLNMFNQIRHNPSRMRQFLGAALDPIISAYPETVHMLTGSHPPLFLQPSLNASAGEMTVFWASGNYTDARFTDMGPMERSVVLGYQGFWNEEISQIALVPTNDASFAVSQLFVLYMLDTLESGIEKNVVLSPYFTDAGIGISILPGNGFDAAIATLDAGIAGGSSAETAGVYGLAYTDLDGNGLYSPGEECPARNILIHEDGLLTDETRTDTAGHFTLHLAANRRYTATIGIPAEATAQFFLDRDLFVPLIMPPATSITDTAESAQGGTAQ